MKGRELTRRDFIKTVSVTPLVGKLGGASPPPWTLRRVGSTAERLREKPYEKRVCRVESYPSCLAPDYPYVGVSVEEYVDIIHKAGLEMQVIGGEVDRGTPRFPSKMLPPAPNLEQDRLPKFLELAHQKGILVLTYYPANNTHALKAIHPEWLMKLLDNGRPELVNEGWFCFNSPYRDWLSEYMIEFLDNLDLDGIYFDDMNWGSHGEEEKPHYPSCCCSYCEKLFRQETGLKIPTKVEFDSMDFRKFVNWRYDKMRAFMLHVARRIRQKHPDAVVDYNYYARYGTDWMLGHPLNPLHLETVGAFFFMETKEIQDGSSFSGKVAKAFGSPFALWRAETQALPECGVAPYAEPLSPTIHGLASLANGGAAVYGMFGGPVELYQDEMKSIFTEVKKRAPYLEGETVKYLALHYSQQTRDFRPSKTKLNCLRVVKGTYEMLNQSHLLVDIVFDEQLTQEHLSPYKVLFLSNCACLSDKQGEQIRKFVDQGGTLIATHETSLLDELGRKRENFLLADMFGVDYVGPQGDGSVQGVVYVPHDEALSREFGYVICMAGEESRVALRPGSAASVLCTRTSLKGKGPLDKFDPKEKYDSGEPTVAVHRFGKGECVYISGDVGGGYIHNPYPLLKRFVSHLVRRVKPPLDIEAPRAIEVTAALRSPRELMIHLLNNPTPLLPFSTSDQDVHTYFYLEEVNPVRQIKIRFNTFKPRRATMPLQGVSLDLVEDSTVLVVPEVKLHEVVIVELES